MVTGHAYLIRPAEATDLAALPSIERRAARLFDGWLTQIGLTQKFLENVSSIDELEEARQRGQLWIAAAPDGELAGFAQVVILDGVAHLDEIDVIPEHGRKRRRESAPRRGLPLGARRGLLESDPLDIQRRALEPAVLREAGLSRHRPATSA